MTRTADPGTAEPDRSAGPGETEAPGDAGTIKIGTEYVLIDNPARSAGVAEMIAPIGLAAAKPLAEHHQWDAMQAGPGAPIDFSRLDAFVSSFQAAGFTELVLALRSRSNWASRGYGVLKSTNDAPKPEFFDDYEAWVAAVVERYDADGTEDMPGLARPVRHYEIGSEFSSYEPEPVADYLEMLERAYRAAHGAYDDVLVAHAAFLTTLAFEGDPRWTDLEAAFRQVPDQTHSLADIRAVLDRPDLFNVANVHSLGRPDEIADITSWLRREMGERGYDKPIVVSDTSTTPFIAWGSATVCDRPPQTMGRIVPPATEADRCRLAEYFAKLIASDEATLDWVRAFAAEDAVKRVVIAAEQGVALINTAFTEDLFWLKLPLAQAGAGNAAWAGQVDFDRRENRPGFYALQQLVAHMGRYDAIRRLRFDDAGLHVYELTAAGRRSWIAWYEAGRLLLPGDTVPTTELRLDVGAREMRVERLITEPGQTEPTRSTVATRDGVATLTLGATPVFIDRASS